MKKLAPVFVILAACLWGNMGIFVRGLSQYGFESLEIVFIRVIGASVLLFLWMLCFNRDKLKINWKDIWCFIGTGIVSIVFFNFCYFSTIQMTSLSVAAIMLYMAPAIVTVLGIWLFKESYHIMKILSLIMALAGCVLVTGVLTSSAVLTVPGILLGIGSGVGYAMYSIFGRIAASKGYQSITISFYTFLLGSIGSLPLVSAKQTMEKIVTQPDCILLVLGLICIPTIAAYIFYTIGLGNMEAGKASILSSIEPVVASLVGFFLYKERMDLLTLIGIVLVLASAVLVNIKEKKA